MEPQTTSAPVAAPVAAAPVASARYISNPFGLLSPSWQAFKLVWLQLLILGLIGVVIGTLANLLPGVRQASSEGASPSTIMLYLPLDIILSLAINSYTGWMSAKIMLAGINGRTISLGQSMPPSVISAVKFILTSFLYVLIVAGGFLLFIVPGIIWAVRYQYALPVCVEEGVFGMAAIRRSGQLTKGHFWEIISVPGVFVAALPLLLIPILGWIAIIVFAFVVGIAGYVRYHQLKQLAAGQLQAVPTHILNYVLGLIIALAPLAWLALVAMAAMVVLQQGGSITNTTY